MTTKRISILRNPGATLPVDYLKKVLAAYNSAGGYAVQAMKDKVPVVVSDRMDTGADFEAVQLLLDQYNDTRVLLHFLKTDKVIESHLQPFDFRMPGDLEPLMSYTLEGTFPTMEEAGIDTTVNFAKRVIIPNFNKFLKLSEGDLQKFIAEIKDETFVDSLMARIGDRATFCFLPPTGDAIWLGKDKQGSTFPWGQVSDTLGYTETPTKKVEEPVTGKKTGWFTPKPKLPVAELPIEAKPAEAIPPVPLDIPGPDAKPDTRIDAPAAKPPTSEELAARPAPKGVWKTIPRGMSKDQRKKLIRRVTNCGNDLPENWNSDEFTYFETEYERAPRTQIEDAMISAQVRKDQTPKDMRSNVAPRLVTEAGDMVLSAEEKSEAESFMLKTMDRGGKEIPNPLDIQKALSKTTSFTKQFGISLDVTKKWLPEDIVAFSKANPKAFTHLYVETVLKLIETEEALAAIGNKHVDSKPVASGTPAITEPLKKVANSGWNQWGKK